MSADSRDSRIAGMDLTSERAHSNAEVSHESEPLVPSVGECSSPSERAGAVPSELTTEQCLRLLRGCLVDAEREVQALTKELAKARDDIDTVQRCRRMAIRLISDQDDKIEALTAERDALEENGPWLILNRCRDAQDATLDYHAAWQDADTERDTLKRLAWVLQQRLRQYCGLSGLKAVLSADDLALYREVFPNHGE